MGPVDFLQSWYHSQTNGEWEHIRGVTIETLDTPGWMVTIDLAGTSLEGVSVAAVQRDRSPRDWLHCQIENKQFRGQGDSQKLLVILETFQHWAAQAAS